MVKIEQLLNNMGESVFPIISEEQIKHKADIKSVGELSKLQTEVKNSLVEAINENTEKIAHNLKQLGLKTSTEDVKELIALTTKELLTKEELDDILVISSTIITINDKILDLNTNKANVEDIPTKVSELVNDEGFVNEVQLTETQIIKKIQEDLIQIFENMEEFASKDDVALVEESVLQKLNNILQSKQYVAKDDVSYMTMQENVKKLMDTITDVVSKEELNLVASTIPTKTSELENDSKFITIEQVPSSNIEDIEKDVENLKLTKAEQEYVKKEVSRLDAMIEAIEIPEGTDVRPIMRAIEELKEGKANKEDIPKLVSELENDLNFITKSDIDAHETVVKILADIQDHFEGIQSLEVAQGVQGEQVSKNKEQALLNKENITKLQVEVGQTDQDVAMHSDKIHTIEEAQLAQSSAIAKNTLDIQANEDKIVSIDATLKTIPKKTSDIINDSGFIDKGAVIAMDLGGNPTIKNIETSKANKSEIPTNVGELKGVELLQTKGLAEEQKKEIESQLTKKADKNSIPKNIGDLYDDIGVVQKEEIKPIQQNVGQNSLDIKALQDIERVVVTESTVSLAERKKGNLYLTFGKKYNTIEDYLGKSILLETNRVAELGTHPTEAPVGTIYILKSNQKPYIVVGGGFKQLSTTEDIQATKEDIMQIISAIQEDVEGFNYSITSHTQKINTLEKNASSTAQTVARIEGQVESNSTIIEGHGGDIIRLKEKDSTHDSKITGLSISKADKIHTHTMQDIPQVKEALNEKANKSDIIKKASQLENDIGFITQEDIPEVDVSHIQEQLNKKADVEHTHHTFDVIDKVSQKNQEEINKETKNSIKEVEMEVRSKANKLHEHMTSDITGLDQDIKSMWTAINGKAFTSHTHMPTDIYLNGQGDKLSDISAKHIDYDGWNTVEDKIKQMQSEITGLEIPNVDNIKKDISALQMEKADKTEVPTKLSQLEQDIDMGSEFVIPRKGEDFKEGEIHVVEVEEPLFSVQIDKMPDNVTHNDGRFIVGDADKYTDIDMTVTSGEGELTLYFEDVSGYFSYTIYHINGDRHDSGWLGKEGDFKHDIKEGDRIIVSTGDPMVCGYRKPPVILKKAVMFEGSPISPKFDDSEILSDITNMKDEMRYKADKTSIPKKVSELENDSGFITKSDLPSSDSFNKYTQAEEPINMNTGDEWHRIIQ